MADTEDYSEEATPTAHHTTHEDGGDDEISLDGMLPDLAAGPVSYLIADGESVTIDAYEQLLIYGQYVIEGSGELTIDSTGELIVIGV